MGSLCELIITKKNELNNLNVMIFKFIVLEQLLIVN
jgi:hypothetical protein